MTNLHLIDLDQELTGQYRFISCWAWLAEDLTFVVDPGPPSTGEHLIAELERLGCERLDFILLTHIHLDHAGTTAGLLKRWPAARVVCHKRGRDHLVAPDRLWEGSRQVLRRAADVYGEPEPVPAEALVDFQVAVEHGVEVIKTPGHAPHHISFVHEGNLFLGEAAGTFSTLGKGSDSRDFYLRPATPPRHFPAVAADSVTRLMALDPFPRKLCFAHHGAYTGDGCALLSEARHQLTIWLEAASRVAAADGGLPVEEAGPALDEFMAAFHAELLRVDPRYARLAELPEDIRIRENQFTRQTLRGMLGHLRSVEK